MAEKSFNSSLLESIKNKLNKIDNKAQNKNSSENNFFAEESKANEKSSQIENKNAFDDYNFNESNLNISNVNSQNSSPQNVDFNDAEDDNLDIDDESHDIKNLSQKISIENKIKEIARNIDESFTFEDFEEDVELDSMPPQYNKIEDFKDNIDDKKLDPIDIELMNLDKEFKAQKQQNKSPKNDEELKKYLDDEFEKEILEIDKANTKNANSNASQDSLNSNSKLFVNNNLFPNFSPAQDYLKSAGSDNKNSSESITRDKVISNSSSQSSNNINSASQFNDIKISADKSNLQDYSHQNNINNSQNDNKITLQNLSNSSSLLKEEVIYQANSSLRKLAEAKSLVNQINNFTDNEILIKIAMNIMEPKLEKWLNDNLPKLVDDIVRKEIEKIMPKG